MSRRKVKKIYNKFSLLYLVKKVIDKYDFERLLKGGCPEDEYYHEALLIKNIIEINGSYYPFSIGNYIFHVFMGSFGRRTKEYTDQEKNLFFEAGEEIAKQIKWYHKIIHILYWCL